ncbi:hypothetical protein FC40_GL001178 [Ligilactobacillus hayakitensis DSM 18933 = JCM 14209]|uniref:Uncharacterized protein n=1 Tax=Ligilactobacillus hayakitensis DSM 18933 = JCM 14209 TaxID=1423755 RepID=A0A0R1WHL8_9LACO|nr:hypothetical protein [Ligilactobacillus hayakitensis]KRM17406.1 hypothetical protein FC40_GL001178 [Ligilactobacillus hayakitensis DSM 18933 = JCM 14209]
MQKVYILYRGNETQVTNQLGVYAKFPQAKMVMQEDIDKLEAEFNISTIIKEDSAIAKDGDTGEILFRWRIVETKLN